MPLGVVPPDVSAEAIAFAKQSFALRSEVGALRARSPEFQSLYERVLRGIASNVKRKEGGFTATSGVQLPYYLNLSTNFMDPTVAPLLVQMLARILLDIVLPSMQPADGERVAIVGMEVAGGMLVSQLAAAGHAELNSQFDFIYMRKKKKETGTAQQLEAMQQFTSRTSASPLLRAVWIDDCNSTGSSLCEGIATLKEDYHIDVQQALYIVDRSVDRAHLPNEKQKLSNEAFVSGHVKISAAMDLSDVDEVVNTSGK